MDQSHSHSDALSGDVQRFSAFLKKAGLSCMILELAESRAELRFTGPFEGRDVVWHCEFVTLATEMRRLTRDDPEAPACLRNFIEIGEEGPGGVPVRVGLSLSGITRQDIDKMMLMIRLYKNLGPGRHEYGEAINPSLSPRSAQDI